MNGTILTPTGEQRFMPAMGAGAYKTFVVGSPLATCYRQRRASCEEVLCAPYRLGWISVVDEATELGRWRAEYIRGRECGRTYSETRTAAGLTEFHFGPGQPCFAALDADHVVSERIEDAPQIYAVRDGDWRGNPTGRVFRHANNRDWCEDFGEHQQRINDQIERG